MSHTETDDAIELTDPAPARARGLRAPFTRSGCSDDTLGLRACAPMPSTGDLLVGLGAAIRELRTEQGLSQEQLYHQTGVHRNYIGGIERAERLPSVDAVNNLALGLGVPVSELFKRAEQNIS